MSEFDKLIHSLKTKKDYNYRHVLRAAALNCRALQVDGQRDEPGDEVAAGREKISTLRDLCLRTVIQGTTLQQLRSLFHSNRLPKIVVKELLSLAFHLSKSPAKISTILSVWPDKHFSLTSDVAESHYEESKYLRIDTFTSMAYKVKAEKSVDKLADFLSHVISILTEFRSWGRDCQIETFDLSGVPISSTTVRILAVLSRLPIPKDWPQLTRNIIVDLSFEHVETERIFVMLRRRRAKLKGPTLFKISLSRVYLFRPLKNHRLTDVWPLISPTYFKGVSLQYAYLTNDSLREDFPGVIRFENLTALDLSNSTFDLSGKQRHSANRRRQIADAIESINYVIKNLKQLQRLDLSDCVITDQLSNLFQDVENKFRYLSLSGCRLSNHDIKFLAENPKNFGSSLDELNLGHNNLRRTMQNLFMLFEKCSNLRFLDIEGADFDNTDLEPLIKCIISNLRSLECFNLSEEMSRQNIWTPAVVSNDVLRPLMTSVSTLAFMFMPHREEFYEQAQDFFTTCPLSQNFLQMIAKLQNERKEKSWKEVKIDWKCKISMGVFLDD